MLTPPTKTDTNARLFALVACLAAFSAAFGCKSEGTPLQVCHVDADSGALEVLTIGGEAELQSHLAHGDPLFGTGLSPDCTGGVGFSVDQSLEPSAAEVQGQAGSPPRLVAVLAGPNGRDEFVVDEIEAPFESEAELDSFLSQYGGTIIRDDVAYDVDEDGVFYEVAGGADGWRLMRVDPSTSGLSDLPANAAAAGFSGSFAASSDAALRTLAIHLREQDRGASANFAMRPDALREHPLQDPDQFPDIESYVDMATQWWMTDDDDSAKPGDQGLSVGLARAFEYMRHVGHPPENAAWTPARVAIIDQGFDLDEQTGLGNPDYNNTPMTPPLQWDGIDLDETAGGVGVDAAPWHGQGAFGVSCASPRNLFGGAGSGAEYVRPILIRSSYDAANAADAVKTAMLMGASVINMSFGWYCSSMCQTTVRRRLQEVILDAANGMGIAIFASAGNGIAGDGAGDANIDGGRRMPCDMGGVTCVGAINPSGANVWNWGEAVDIWAPTNIASTVSPDSADNDTNDWGFDEVRTFGGTSAASPFVAGIAGLMKSLAPGLPGYHIEEILQKTANESSDPMVLKGYVDALRAVQAVRGNPAPIVTITRPHDGTRPSWGRDIEFGARAYDPADTRLGFHGTVEFYSDRDGLICGTGDRQNCFAPLSTLGAHSITAVATDDFGASTTSESIEIEVSNYAPSVEMVSPRDGAIHYTNQRVSFRALVYDHNEEDFTPFCAIVSADVACAEWTSSLDGLLLPYSPGEETALNLTSELSQGLHTITVTVRDGFGETSTTSTTVNIQPGQGKPTARILTPVEDITFTKTIVLRGQGTDPEDGLLSGSNLEWFSNIDGFLGSGAAISVQLTGPECEGELTHLITLRATDSDGNEGVDELSIRFNLTC